MKTILFEYSIESYKTVFCHDFNSIESIGQYSLAYHRKSRWKVFNSSSESDTKKDFEDNFKNQMCSLYKNKCLVILEKEKTKLRLKIYENSYNRLVGRPYSTRKTNCKYFSVDIDSGDFYYGNVKNYHKKLKFTKSVRKNCVYSKPFASILLDLKSLLNKKNPELQKIIHTVKNTFFTELNLNTKLQPDDAILEFYLKKKGIKYPNNFTAYYNKFDNRLKLAYLRKNGMKLVDSFMKFHELSGDVIRKCLHSANSINVIGLKNVLDYFYPSWVLQDEDLVKKILEQEYSSSWFGDQFFYIKSNSSKKEFNNFFECFKLSLSNSSIAYSSLVDHVEFYSYLKQAGEDLKWKSNTSEQFRKEHLDWADKFEFYKKGSYTRIYPDSFDTIFKNPITHGDSDYYPILLKKSSEYNEESMCQSNCVKTYIGRTSSIIVSIRKNSITSDERGTIEYQLFKQNEKVNFIRPQSLGRYNYSLSEEWNPILKEMDERIKRWIDGEKNFVTVKIEKVLDNLGKKLYSDSDWLENGFLHWTYSPITRETGSYMNQHFPL